MSLQLSGISWLCPCLCMRLTSAYDQPRKSIGRSLLNHTAYTNKIAGYFVKMVYLREIPTSLQNVLTYGFSKMRTSLVFRVLIQPRLHPQKHAKRTKKVMAILTHFRCGVITLLTIGTSSYAHPQGNIPLQLSWRPLASTASSLRVRQPRVRHAISNARSDDKCES
jgi:hypothetical protein